MNRSIDDEDEFEDPELPDRSDMDLEEFTVLSRCPSCKKMIADESEICPYCGDFIIDEQTPAKYPLWVTLGMVLAVLGIFFGWILHF